VSTTATLQAGRAYRLRSTACAGLTDFVADLLHTSHSPAVSKVRKSLQQGAGHVLWREIFTFRFRKSKGVRAEAEGASDVAAVAADACPRCRTMLARLSHGHSVPSIDDVCTTTCW
jgi:hypothetical protein